MVAFHFPPIRVSSGVQRSLAFIRYLPEKGWNPIVLTAHLRAYDQVCDDQIKDIPESVPVERAFSLDTSRHLSIAGRYFDFMALPDRWVTWLIGGVWSGLKLIRKYRPKIIWTTYPIATAHLIGLTLHKLTRLPWVADFRDSMVDDSYPVNVRQKRIFYWIEKVTLKHCRYAIFTTSSAIEMYKERYPHLRHDKFKLIPNGYDDEFFHDIEYENHQGNANKESMHKPLILVHSGVIYPSERDPLPFFRALSNLKRNKLIDDSRLKIILRATGNDALYRPLLREYKIDDIVSLETALPYREALKEMISSNGLLIFQAANCNHQVPAKIYEYFRAQKPILALTDPNGDTAKTMFEAGLSAVVPLDDEVMIEESLLGFLNELASGEAAVANQNVLKKYSRKYGVGSLLDIFNDCSK
ncbi:MAG: glycosyltransferase [Sedimenticola sp.]